MQRHTHRERMLRPRFSPGQPVVGERTMASVVRLHLGLGLGLANEPELTCCQFGADPRVLL